MTVEARKSVASDRQPPALLSWQVCAISRCLWLQEIKEELKDSK